MLFSLNIRISTQSFDKAAPLAVKGRRRFLSVKITFAQVNPIFSFSFFAFKISCYLRQKTSCQFLVCTFWNVARRIFEFCALSFSHGRRSAGYVLFAHFCPHKRILLRILSELVASCVRFHTAKGVFLHQERVKSNLPVSSFLQSNCKQVIRYRDIEPPMRQMENRNRHQGKAIVFGRQAFLQRELFVFASDSVYA